MVMMNKKLLSLLLSASIVGVSTGVLTLPASAETKDNIASENTQIDETSVITPRTVGSVVVTAKSGANIRSGAGTEYSIKGTLAYGEDAPYAYESKKDSNGTTWYKIEWGSSYGWISSSTCKLT